MTVDVQGACVMFRKIVWRPTHEQFSPLVSNHNRRVRQEYVLLGLGIVAREKQMYHFVRSYMRASCAAIRQHVYERLYDLLVVGGQNGITHEFVLVLHVELMRALQRRAFSTHHILYHHRALFTHCTRQVERVDGLVGFDKAHCRLHEN